MLPNGRIRVIREARDPTRLGQDLGTADGRLSPEAMRRSAEAIRTLEQIARVEGASHIRAVATAAVREATNRSEFVDLVAELAGLPLEILSEDDEARLAFDGVAHSFDFSHAVGAVADIGGGSLEVVLSVHGVPFRAVSMPLGAVRLTTLFGGAEKSSGPRFSEMRKHVRAMLRDRLERPPRSPSLVVGTGGTFSSLAWLTIAKGYAPSGPAAPKVLKELPRAAISRTRVKKLLANLRPLPVAARVGTERIPADRADVIIAGLVVVDELLKHLGVDALRAHDAGLRDGLLLSLAAHAADLAKERASGTRAPARERAGPRRGPVHGTSVESISPERTLLHVREYARRCKYERPHSEQVAKLSLSIFDQLAEAGFAPAPPGFFAPRTRVLLEAAAVLHDVGIAVAYRRHHKHSRDMIRLAELPGLDAREREIIAVIARYHRKSPPSLKHPEYRGLAPSERSLAAGLAGILRIADGLDRSHRRVVRSVRIELAGQSRQQRGPDRLPTANAHRAAAASNGHAPAFAGDLSPVCFFHVRARTHARAELAAARQKSDLFEQAFSTHPELAELPRTESTRTPVRRST